MRLITEQEIEQQLTKLNATSPEHFAQAVAEFTEQQPTAFSYLMVSAGELLTQNEKEYQIYLALIIWMTVQAAGTGVLNDLDDELIGQYDEQNWTQYNEAKGRSFRDKLDGFFEDYLQEDLLAFVEDALVDDDDDELTDEGRPLLFINLKSLIDAWTLG